MEHEYRSLNEMVLAFDPRISAFWLIQNMVASGLGVNLDDILANRDDIVNNEVGRKLRTPIIEKVEKFLNCISVSRLMHLVRLIDDHSEWQMADRIYAAVY